jgi:hypothetical protein
VDDQGVLKSMKITRAVVYLVFATNLSLAVSLTDAATPMPQDPDWPCEQILVPEVPAAVVWAGPTVDGLGSAWKKASGVSGLVQRITSPVYNQSTAEQAIAAFASMQEPRQKDEMLTLLFAGVLDTLNRDRSRMLQGIMRYSRGQSARAMRLGEDLDEIAHLEDDPSPAAQERLRVMQKGMLLKQRIFDEREGAIQYLCSRPVAIEQRLGFLARTIAAQLD